MMKSRVTSRCECEAKLSATLDEKRHVLAATAKRRGSEAHAVAHSIHAEAERFDIGWLCPFCHRNVLRTFHMGALQPIAAAT